MRWMISRNAARYSGRACRSGRMRKTGIEERQEARRSQGTARQPAVKHRNLACAGMKALRQGQQAAPIVRAGAREHDSKAGHEKARSGTRPARRIQLARGAQLEEPIFILPIDPRREMTVGRRLGRRHLEDPQARSDSVRQ